MADGAQLTYQPNPDMFLVPGDELTEAIPLDEAARRVGVTRRTVSRWITGGHLRAWTVPCNGTVRTFVIDGEVRRCEADRHRAQRRGRPGARVSLTG